MNAIMITISHNDDLKKAILKIYENVNNNYYGNSDLEPTGPLLLKSIINKDIDFNFHSYKNKQIIREYNEYRDEQKKYDSKYRYSTLWNCKLIYNNFIKKDIIINCFNNINNLNLKQFNNQLLNLNFIYYDKVKSENFLNKFFSKKIYSTYMYIYKNKNDEIINFLKYCFLYINGGIFVNNSIKLNKNFENVLLLNYKYNICMCNGKYYDDILIADKYFYIFKLIIDKIVLKVKKNKNFNTNKIYNDVINKELINNKLIDNLDINIIPLFKYIME